MASEIGQSIFHYFYQNSPRVSHLKERKEKNCLNCNAEVMGKYCHVCGQENIEPEESAMHLVRHFFEDITHFDGKFFTSLKYLITKPGFLSREYMAGRRASYLNPVRMYVFTSAIFFLLFFSMNHFEERKMDDVLKLTINGKSMQEITAMNAAMFAAFTAEINKKDGKAATPMTRAGFARYTDSVTAEGLISFSDKKYKSAAAYDSAEAVAASKDGWIMKKLIYKQIELNEKYKRSGNQMFGVLFAGLLHRLPQMMFISLPLLALLLKMLYYRKKEFYFVSHGIFCIHFYIFVFIDILLITGFTKLYQWCHWNIFNLLASILGFAIFFYLYKAMRNFYQQRRFKTIVKFSLFNILTFVVQVILFLIFLMFSFFTI